MSNIKVSQYNDEKQSWAEDVTGAYGHTFNDAEEAIEYLKQQPFGGEIEVTHGEQITEIIVMMDGRVIEYNI